ncbi:hypothetical protein MMC29_003870 [Sticta canariensis]|nr:hypothetical protein [Sticta canariensis]
MAEAAGLAASILAIAGAGISITTTLYRFTKSYQSTDRKVEGIVTTVSVTASILTELGNAIKEHPDDLQKLNRWTLFSDTIAGCKKDFEIIELAIGAARKGGATMQDQQKIRKDDKSSATPWQKLKWAIGGELEVEDLLGSLERSKSNLQLLLDASNYDTLRKLEKSHALNPQLVEQLAEIRAILPWLVTNMSKLGYRPGRADGSDKHLGLPQELSFGEQKAPPDSDSSAPPSQEIKDGKKEPHPCDNVLSVESNPDDGKDVLLPPNVQEPLPPQAVSREPVLDVIQGPSPEHPNHATGETLSPVVLLTRNQSPAAASNGFDSAKYEVWLLTHHKAHFGGDTGFKEMVLITKPFKYTITWGGLIPASYHFFKAQLPESELQSAILEKEATPVIEVIASLPLATQEAVDDLRKRRYARRPSLARVNIVKRSAWGRLIGRRKKLPSLLVFLECQPDENWLQQGPPLTLPQPLPPLPRRRRFQLRQEETPPPLLPPLPPLPPPPNFQHREQEPPPSLLPPLHSLPPPPNFQHTQFRRRDSGRDRSRRPRVLARARSGTTMRRSNSSETYSEVEEDAIEKRRREMASLQPSRFENTVVEPHNYRNTFWQNSALSRSLSEASKASGKQALPSEQEAERIMEEFLSKLATSQDNEDLTRQDNAIAATVTADSNEAEQEVRG